MTDPIITGLHDFHKKLFDTMDQFTRDLADPSARYDILTKRLRTGSAYGSPEYIADCLELSNILREMAGVYLAHGSGLRRCADAAQPALTDLLDSMKG